MKLHFGKKHANEKFLPDLKLFLPKPGEDSSSWKEGQIQEDEDKKNPSKPLRHGTQRRNRVQQKQSRVLSRIATTSNPTP
jgi:hypothetical protein